MPTVVPLMTAGAAVGMCLSAAPRVVRIPLLVGVMALATFELTKEGSEAFNAAAIFGGQGEQGAAQMIDPKKVEADDAAGREVSAAKRTITAQWQGLSGDALLKQSQGVAAAESERELLAKRAKGIKLTSMESLRLS